VGPVPVLATPLRLSDSPGRLDRIPALGEDTDSILRDLGYSDADILSLRGDKTI
jgi:crotonobetainyl-CoA:carnitine CoA-transferase CaiB-like acyl-CoA transferase